MRVGFDGGLTCSLPSCTVYGKFSTLYPGAVRLERIFEVMVLASGGAK